MKWFWLILAAAPAFCLNAQTNFTPVVPDAGLFSMPTVSLKHTNAPAHDEVLSTNIAITTNAVPHFKTNAPPKESPTYIHAEHGEVDLKNRVVVYSGDVVVTNSQMKLTCNILTASVPTNSTQVDHIVAEGNVKIEGADNKGRPIHARSDKAIYIYAIENSVTNKTMTLTGNVYVDSALGKGTADPIVWDLINDKIHMENQDMQIQPEAREGTNSPLAKPFGKSFP